MKAFDYKTGQAYFRDGLVPFKEAQLSIASSPVLYGLAVYTVFNVRYDAAKRQLYIFRLADHYRRLCDSAKIMDFADFSSMMNYEVFQKTMINLLLVNKIRENVLVRATLFIDELIAGTKANGLKTSFSAYIYPMAPLYPAAGVHACVSSWQRTPDNAIPSRAKVNGSYANATLMKNEALKNGFDEAIALDGAGHVTEGTVANLFMVRGGELITPDQSTDILEGITRDTILKLADNMNIPLRLRAVDRSELYIADELFYCGSSARITPILSVDKRKVGGAGSANSLTSKLAQAYEDAQMNESVFAAHWLTIVAVR